MTTAAPQQSTRRAPARKGTTRRTSKAPVRRKVSVITPARLVEDDLEVLAAEHAAHDAALLALVARLVA